MSFLREALLLSVTKQNDKGKDMWQMIRQLLRASD